MIKSLLIVGGYQHRDRLKWNEDCLYGGGLWIMISVYAKP